MTPPRRHAGPLWPHESSAAQRFPTVASGGAIVDPPDGAPSIEVAHVGHLTCERRQREHPSLYDAAVVANPSPCSDYFARDVSQPKLKTRASDDGNASNRDSKVRPRSSCDDAACNCNYFQSQWTSAMPAMTIPPTTMPAMANRGTTSLLRG